MSALLGHEEPWHEWRAAMASDRMHHAWILSGPQGVGKGSFARAAAAELVAQAGVPQPAPGAHPDILIPEHPPATKEDIKKRDAGEDYNRKRSIGVDEIRAMQTRLITRPTLGSRRVVILDPADDLEKAAVNALLKSLEEPPAGTFFLLVTHRIGRLLPTIRSRCRILRFAPLSEGQVDLVLSRRAPHVDEATRRAAIAAARGAPGVALEFIEEDLAPLHQIMQRLLGEGDAGLALRGALATELGPRPSRQRLAATFELARACLAQKLKEAAGSAAATTAIIETHSAMMVLGAQAPIYNYDPGLLAMEIGGLLAQAALPREAAV